MKIVFSIRLNVRVLINTYNEYVYDYGGETITADEVYDLLKASMKWHDILESGPRDVWLISDTFKTFLCKLSDTHYNGDWLREALCAATKVSFL